MSHLSKLLHKFWWITWLPLFLVACAENSTQETITATASLSPQVYLFHTATPSQTPQPIVDLTPIPITPAPTATPFTHKVAKGETMLGIALTYGIKLEDFLAANPTVNPRILSIDTVLIVPLPIRDTEPTPTITPLPLTMNEPLCYPSINQDLYCMVSVQNSLDQGVENLSAWVGLFDGERLLASQIVVPALNILQPGERFALLANFTGPLPADARPRVELLTALPVSNDDPRYLQAQMEIQQVVFAADGLQAHISGRVSWQLTQPVPGTIWVAVIAYDAVGNPVGVRKLETRPSCSQEVVGTGCTSSDVDLMVYSLGPAIHYVEALVEARP